MPSSWPASTRCSKARDMRGEDPGASPSCKRVRGALGAQCSGRVPGLDPGLEPSPPRAGAVSLRRPLQPRPPPPIGLKVPTVTDKVPLRTGPIERIDVLGGGLIHEYHRAA